MAALNRIARWPMILRPDALFQNGERQRSLFTRKDVTRYQRRAIRQAVDLLGDGRLLVVFPEGYPNVDPTYTPKQAADAFLPFKRGFVAILDRAERRLAAPVPALPVGFTTPKKNRGSPMSRLARRFFATSSRAKTNSSLLSKEK
jgi:putative membrane protein